MKKLRLCYKNCPFYICQITRVDSTYTQIQVNLPQTVLCIKYKMESPSLIAYASKRFPKAAHNYSITELEMCGLAINIVSLAPLLERVDFDAIVDHLPLVHILKSKTEPATTRIKRLLEVLSAYSFNLYFMKGMDMTLSNFCQDRG